MKWVLQLHENGQPNCIEVMGEEDFIFRSQSLTARWNNNLMNVPSFSKLKAIKLYATSPFFYENNEKEPKKNRLELVVDSNLRKFCNVIARCAIIDEDF